MKTLLAFSILVIASSSTFAQTQRSTIGDVISVMRSRVSDIPLDDTIPLSLTGEMSNKKACAVHFSGTESQLTVRMESDAGNGQQNISIMNLDSSEVMGSPTGYDVIRLFDNEAMRLTLKVIRHETNRSNVGAILADNLEEQTLILNFTDAGAVESMQLILGRGLSPRNLNTCIIDKN